MKIRCEPAVQVMPVMREVHSKGRDASAPPEHDGTARRLGASSNPCQSSDALAEHCCSSARR